MSVRDKLEIAVLKRKVEVLEAQLSVKKQKNDMDQGKLETIAMLMKDWNAPGIDKEREWMKMTAEDNLANAIEMLELLDEGGQTIQQLENIVSHQVDQSEQLLNQVDTLEDEVTWLRAQADHRGFPDTYTGYYGSPTVYDPEEEDDVDPAALA